MRGRVSSIPRFSPVSLTTARVRWLHEETWDDAQKAAFLQLRQAPQAGAYAALPFVKNRRQAAPCPVGRWLLEWPDGTAVAAADAQAQVMQFTTVTVLLSAAEWAEGETRAALTLLVSGLLLLTEADVLRLLPLAPTGGTTWSAADLGTAHVAWTPLATLARLRTPQVGGLRLPVITVDPIDWWTTAHGAADRRSLAYLEKRLALEAGRAEAQTARARPVGILALLARLLRRGNP